LRVCLRLPAYSASAKVICFIGKLGGWGRGILPNQKVFFRVSLDQAIRDVLVDFVYQGFTKGPNPMKAGMRNDKAELIRYIENTPAIRQYEPGRNRARYLRNN
ncbi:MAG: hypothetical protein ACOZF1_08390, partial [Pseudomonadota bacterium]